MINIKILPQTDKQFIIIFSLLAVLFVYPFIQSDFLYSDDICRAVDPTYTWMWDGRILVDILYRVLGFGKVMNFFPLYHIIIILLLVYIGYLLYQLLFYGYTPVIASFFSFILLMNPFYLEQLSFQYDSLSITLNILLGVLAVKNLFDYTKIWKPIIYLLGFFLLYQPNLPFMTSIILLKLFFLTLEGKNYQWNLVLKIAVVFVISLVLYYVSISWLSIERAHSRYNISLMYILPRLYEYGIKYILNWNILWLIGFFTIYGTLIIKYIKKQQYTVSHLSLSIVLFLPLILILNASIPFTLIADPNITPRIFIGASGFIFFIVWGFYSIFNKISYKFSRICLAIIIFYLIGMSYAYNQAQKHQKDFSLQVANQLVTDITKLPVNYHINTLFVVGKAPYSPITQGIVKHYPYFNFYNLQQQGISNRSWRTQCYLKHFPIIQIENIYNHKDLDKISDKKKILIANNAIYSLSTIGKNTVLLKYQ